MKIKLPLATIAIASISLISATIDWTKPQTRTLAWDYPTTNDLGFISWNIYASTDISVPLSSWTLFTNVAATNLTMKTFIGTNGFKTNTFYLSFQQVPQLEFFTAKTYSSFYGDESDFCNVTNFPAAPVSSRNLRIQ